MRWRSNLDEMSHECILSLCVFLSVFLTSVRSPNTFFFPCQDVPVEEFERYKDAMKQIKVLMEIEARQLNQEADQFRILLSLFLFLFLLFFLSSRFFISFYSKKLF